MRKSMLAMFLPLLFLAIGSARAQEDTHVPPEIRNASRVKHDRSPSLPIGIAFRETLRLVDFYYSDDPSSAVTFVAQETGMTTNDATEFVSQGIATLSAIEAENIEATRAMACEGIAYDRDPYTVLEQIDDEYESIAEKHYSRTRDSMSNENSARLRMWLNSQKMSITHVKFDRKKLSDVTGSTGSKTINRLCSGV